MSEWSWERRWLASVEAIERELGAPVFSNLTKMEVGTGLSPEEIVRAQAESYRSIQRRMEVK